MTKRIRIGYSSMLLWLPSAMVARLASIAKRHQKVAGSSPAVVKDLMDYFFVISHTKFSKYTTLSYITKF